MGQDATRCRNEDFRCHLLIVFLPNVSGKLAIHGLNYWVIQELLLVDLAKTQYTRDDEGSYFCTN